MHSWSRDLFPVVSSGKKVRLLSEFQVSIFLLLQLLFWPKAGQTLLLLRCLSMDTPNVKNRPRRSDTRGSFWEYWQYCVSWPSGWFEFLMIIHYFVLLYFIYSSAHLFYFAIFKRTFKNKSAKLFLRGPSASHTFIKYLLTQDDWNNPESQPEQQNQGPGKKAHGKLLVSGHSQGPGTSQKEKSKQRSQTIRNSRRINGLETPRALDATQPKGCTYKQGHRRGCVSWFCTCLRRMWNKAGRALSIRETVSVLLPLPMHSWELLVISAQPGLRCQAHWTIRSLSQVSTPTREPQAHLFTLISLHFSLIPAPLLPLFFPVQTSHCHKSIISFMSD